MCATHSSSRRTSSTAEGATRAIRQSVQYGHTRDMAVCAIWPLVQYGRLCRTATYAARPHAQYDHLCHMATCAVWPAVQYGHLCRMATCAIWPPVRYATCIFFVTKGLHQRPNELRLSHLDTWHIHMHRSYARVCTYVPVVPGHFGPSHAVGAGP